MDKCLINRIKLAKEFKKSQRAFIALGDETRQHIFMALLESDNHGIRVGEL